MATIKEPIIHRDIFGAELNVGDLVLLPNRNFNKRLSLGIIKKINPRMISIKSEVKRKNELRYPDEILRVTDDPRATLYMIKNSGK